jgi:lysophospholipase L1-like esterase
LLRLVAINLLLVALLLLAIEGCVRVTHPRIGPAAMDAGLVAPARFGSTPGLQPEAKGQVYGAEVAVDAHGFIAYTAPQRRAPVWLFLGDSVTMGIGVPSDSTFAGRLAAEVDTAAIRNPSLIGYGAADYVAVLRGLVSGGHQDVRRVTVFWCLNDAQDRAAGAQDPDAGLRRRAGAALLFLQRYVYTYQWAKATLADRPMVYFLHDRAFYEGDAFTYAAEHLRDLKTVADSAGVRLDLVVIPYEAQVRPDAPAHALHPQRRLAEAAAELDLRLIDAAEAFHGADRPSALFRYGDGIHLSTEGHARLAHFLRDVL